MGIELDWPRPLQRCASANGAAVAGGIPVIPGLQQGLAGDRITRIEAIPQRHCNYILSRMEAGAAFADVSEDAQKLGYAEAIPAKTLTATMLVPSWSSSRASRSAPTSTSKSVACRSITAVDAVDLVYAHDLNCTIRQISKAELRPDGVAAAVGPMLVPLRSPFAWSAAPKTWVLVSGQYGGDVVFLRPRSRWQSHGRRRRFRPHLARARIARRRSAQPRRASQRRVRAAPLHPLRREGPPRHRR